MTNSLTLAYLKESPVAASGGESYLIPLISKWQKGRTRIPFRQMLHPKSAPNGNGPACLVNRHIHNLSLGYADMCMR